MGIAQLSRLARAAKVFARKHSTGLQWAAVGTATAGMWGGIFMVEKQTSETTRKVMESLKQEQAASNAKLSQAYAAPCDPYQVPENVEVLEAENYTVQDSDNFEGNVVNPKYCNENTATEILTKGIKRGEHADTIGNVVFDKGLVTSIEINEDYGFGVGSSPAGNSAYTVTLSDGSTVNFVPQYATNKAKVSKKDGALVFEGLNRMYFNKEVSKLGKYKFFGCTGFVNTEGGAGDRVTSGSRRLSDGSRQESSLFLCEGRDPQEKDVYKVTENDRMYGGN